MEIPRSPQGKRSFPLLVALEAKLGTRRCTYAKSQINGKYLLSAQQWATMKTRFALNLHMTHVRNRITAGKTRQSADHNLGLPRTGVPVSLDSAADKDLEKGSPRSLANDLSMEYPIEGRQPLPKRAATRGTHWNPAELLGMARSLIERYSMAREFHIGHRAI